MSAPERRSDFDPAVLENNSGLNRFALVNAVRDRVAQLERGAPAKLPLSREKHVSMAMREIARGKLSPTAPIEPPPQPHVIEANGRYCVQCGHSESDIVDGRAPGRCRVA